MMLIASEIRLGEYQKFYKFFQRTYIISVYYNLSPIQTEINYAEINFIDIYK